MAGALRVISVQRGHDPREFALVAFGGAGPAARQRGRGADGLLPGHRPALAGPAVRAGRPRRGLPQRVRADADPPHRRRRPTTPGDPRRPRRARAREWMDAQGIAADDQHVEFLADMRYRGQGYEIPVPMGEDLEERFNALHEQLYGFRMPNTASEIVNLRAVGTGDRPQPELPGGRAARPSVARAPARYARAELHPGTRIAGPSIVTEFDSTTVVLDGYDGRDRPLLQPADPPGGLVMAALQGRRDPRPRGRPDHARHHRERAPPRALRDGRGAVPQRHVPGHPRAARRVPDAHRPAGAGWSSASSAPTSAR